MSGDVAKLEPMTPQAPAQQSEGAVVLAMIDKLIARPDVPVEKLEQMFALHQKVQAEAARRAYLSAFAAMQSSLPAAVRAGKGHNDKAYARYEDVANALREQFALHGFSHWFGIEHVNDRVKITTCLGHSAGHVETTSLVLPLDTSGNKSTMHAVGSTVSYGKRYGLLTITGIATADDDDGKGAGDKPTSVTVEQITQLIKDSGSQLTWFLQHYSVETLEDLNGKQRDEIKAKLTAKLAAARRTNANR